MFLSLSKLASSMVSPHVTTPKYANIVRNVDDSREPMKKFMLSSSIFIRSPRDGKKHGFVVQFNHVESLWDIYNGEHFGILREGAFLRSSEWCTRVCGSLCLMFGLDLYISWCFHWVSPLPVCSITNQWVVWLAWLSHCHKVLITPC